MIPYIHYNLKCLAPWLFSQLCIVILVIALSPCVCVCVSVCVCVCVCVCVNKEGWEGGRKEGVEES